MKKKLTALAVAVFAAVQSFGCWYNRINYNDYIFGLNNFEQHTWASSTTDPHGKALTTFHIRNNMVVDFPVTASIKLVSDSRIVVDDDSKKPEILRCKLQYRVLPDGNWTTVGEYDVPTGKIPASAPPAPYLGRNNIWPKKCKAGDVIMIRLYVTDGQFQSGDLADKCEEKCGYGSSQDFPDKYTLPDTFDYTPNEQQSILEVDLGGMWTPQYVVTVIYSGKTRPIQ